MKKKYLLVKRISLAALLLLALLYSMRHAIWTLEQRAWVYSITDYISYKYACGFHGCASSAPIASRFVAHAGGSVDGKTYTNSLQALDRNYALGHRVFELDFDLTSDQKLVAIHGWEQAELYGFPEGNQPTLHEFMTAKRSDGLTQMDKDVLLKWLVAHPDASIVTDVKSDNLQVLNLLEAGTPWVTKRIIPQIYSFSEYPKVKALGFERVIYTNYVKRYPLSMVFNFAKSAKLSAVTLPDRLQTSIESQGIPIFFHTINDCAQVHAFIKEKNAYGFYTDHIAEDWCGLGK